MCDPTYHPNRFDGSAILLMVLSPILILALARFGTIYSFKVIFRRVPRKMRRMVQNNNREEDHLFQGFFLSTWHSIMYLLLFGTALTLAIVYKEVVEVYEELGVQVITFLLTFYFIDEVVKNSTHNRY
jgi:hypothetical protein